MNMYDSSKMNSSKSSESITLSPLRELKLLRKIGVNYHLRSMNNKEISPAREKYFDLVNNPKKVEKLLEEGEAKALKIASKNLKEIRSLVGIKAL